MLQAAHLDIHFDCTASALGTTHSGAAESTALLAILWWHVGDDPARPQELREPEKLCSMGIGVANPIVCPCQDLLASRLHG
jgi:hypothetical protein